MSRIKIKDNSKIPKASFSNISRLIGKIADKTLEQLECEGVFVFPELLREANDITKDQLILQSVNNFYRSSNVMGFLGLGNEKLIIESRFSNGEHDFLFQYLLERVFDIPNIIDLEADADNQNRIFDLLILVFPHYLRKAMRKGVYKTYIRNRYNDSNVKGTIDVARHISKNTPFIGNIAYSQREYSYDNVLMELVRHTIEFIKQKSYGYKILSQVKEEIRIVLASTPNYEVCDRQKIINANKTNIIRHAFYKEYRELQHLCLLILQYHKHQIGFGSKQIYGLLFDGAWLWEEYMNLILGDIFYHPMNKENKGSQKLFAHNTGTIYPDFINKNSQKRVIADAKYKPTDNIGNKDYFQILAYMLRFDANIGLYLYPEIDNNEKDLIMWLNKGSTYEHNVEPRNNICVIKHGFKIPNFANDFHQFSLEMKNNELLFRNDVRNYVTNELF